MDRLRRLYHEARRKARHAAERLGFYRGVRYDRRELDESLAKRSQTLLKRIDELTGMAADKPDQAEELQVKIEELRAERGDINDRRNRLRRRVFPRLRDAIRTWYRRRKAQIRRHDALREKYEDRKRRRENQIPATGGVTTYDGKPVAAWFVPWLQRIRGRGRWKGVVVSGYRSPAYSTQLCMNMCGAPSCPGRCAGAGSNHSGSAYPAGAIDVSDYYNFAAEAKAVGAPFFNALGAQDPVHFSTTGR